MWGSPLFGQPSSPGQSPGSTMGGALPSTIQQYQQQSPYSWLNNWLSGFNIPSTTGANGLPQIGTPGSQMAPQRPQMSPMQNTMGQPGGGMMGVPYWMQMLRAMGGLNQQQSPATTVPRPQPLPASASQPQVTPPAPVAPAAPAQPPSTAGLFNPVTGQGISPAMAQAAQAYAGPGQQITPWDITAGIYGPNFASGIPAGGNR